jgi:dihydrofolate reductase
VKEILEPGEARRKVPARVSANAWKRQGGNNPRYHADVFILTHHGLAPIEMEGGTRFHFVTEGVQVALDKARSAATGRDVRLGGA